MAAAMTYSSLVSDISSYLERTDTATLEKIPTFIMLAEQVISSEIQFLGNLTVVTSQMNASEAIIVKPARWRKTVSMNLTINGQRQPIFLRKYEYLRNYWPNPTLTDTPVYYCDYDYTHWFVAPNPNRHRPFLWPLMPFQRSPVDLQLCRQNSAKQYRSAAVGH